MRTQLANVADVERLVACGDTLAQGFPGRIGQLHAQTRFKRGRRQVQSVHLLADERS
jgi:hypothetical protein